LNVNIEDISDKLASLALQGPTSGATAETGGRRGHRESEIFSRHARKNRGRGSGHFAHGYTGDLGYEIWIPWNDAPKVWDALVEHGKDSICTRREWWRWTWRASKRELILIEVDYFSSKKALIESQKYSPYEIGLGRLVDLRKNISSGARAGGRKTGAGRGDADGTGHQLEDVERLYDAVGLRLRCEHGIACFCAVYAADCKWGKRVHHVVADAEE